MDFAALYKRLKKEEPPLSCGAVIVAAGNAQRMGFDKLSYLLDGEPVLVRAIRAFEQVPGGRDCCCDPRGPAGGCCSTLP